jgi:diadenylate cyclase
MQEVIEFIRTYWKAAFEIALLAAIIYYFLLLFRGTRGAAVFTGFIIALLLVTGLTHVFELDVMNAILGRVLPFLAIAVLVIFQPELRRALAQIGSQPLFSSSAQRGEVIDVLVETARVLSQKHFGGLIAIEREIGFRGLTETGVTIDAKASVELLTTIFHVNTPLHDGGVVMRGERVISAGCVFPLTQRPNLSTSLGMRHRAAIGLSEETDAIVLVVSEENGTISIAQRGHLLQELDPKTLRTFLSRTLTTPARPANWFVDLARRFVATLFSSRVTPPTGAGSADFTAPPDSLPPAESLPENSPADKEAKG